MNLWSGFFHFFSRGVRTTQDVRHGRPRISGLLGHRRRRRTLMLPPNVPFFLSHPSPSPATKPLFSLLAAVRSIFSPELSAIAMRPSPSSSTPPPMTFSSPASLSAFLRPRLPDADFASWGVAAGTKTVTNLFIELSEGETSIVAPSDSQYAPLRSVEVAVVEIINSRGARLIESHQLLSDGTVRYRHRPLSEKMKAGESIVDAAVRAVKEEIGMNVTVNVVEESIVTKTEMGVSGSYPGLPTKYVLHTVEARVEGLPQEEEFETEEHGEEVEEGAVVVKRHYWKWVGQDNDDGFGGDGGRS